ncbi:amino acid/amide ABC transporter substrate-binding protein, HAAT family [Halovenus aranensis]|uniref:Amino acid/amide ABC transporter substrate-binding protein, HAAT family n=1 Tax=Halovenus aranensis TaxID=890420 RepID=A0A1G8X469_9EURY|nr:amino acid/amide ABC transporter substrate-binding protein, HAAT family [Halovenus aranensis]
MNENRTSSRDSWADRRTFLKATGTGVLATGLAGCIGTEDGDDGDGGDDSDGGTTDGGSSPDSVTFGQPASLTGTWDFLQPAASAATDLAVQEINDAGGPLDAELTVDRQDTAVETQQARETVRQFVNSGDVAAINGLFSSEIEPLWDFLQDQEVPIVTPWPGSTFLDTRGGDKGTDDMGDDEWLWRTVIGDTVHTSGAARGMLDEAGIEKMAILSATSAGEQGWTEQFTDWYEQLGGEIVKTVTAQEGQASYQSQLNELFESDFDAWALSFALEDAITIIQNWSDGGYGGQLLMEDGLRDTALIDEVGETAEGAWIAAGSTQGPNYDQFQSSYQETSDEDLHTWAVAAYDATNVLALAVHHAGDTSPEAVQQSIGDISRPEGTTVTTFAEGKDALDNGEEINYEGAVTDTDFTEHGNVWGDVVVERITPGGFETEFTIPADELKEEIDEY